MLTREIVDHLAAAARNFPLLGEITSRDLLDLVRLELGNENALDDFQPYGQHSSKAIGPAVILHVISGNTPHAGLQSLIRGLILQSHNYCKIPSAGLPEIERFRDALPPELAGRIEISKELPDEWLHSADAVVVFGDDETIRFFGSRVKSSQRFIAHGHRISFGLVFEDPGFDSVAGAAQDASLYDQQGCLSPHLFYVSGSAREYAAHLAKAMAAFQASHPRRKLAPAEAAPIHALRTEFDFRAANGEAVEVWKSETGTDWTVIYDAMPAFTPSCLNRVVYIKPLPAALEAAVTDIKEHLSTIGIWPCNLKNATRTLSLGASRICEIGRMQSPRFTWHQDGQQALAPLVRWVDLEFSGK